MLSKLFLVTHFSQFQAKMLKMEIQNMSRKLSVKTKSLIGLTKTLF